MNESGATVIFGVVGQPAGSVAGDDVFDADGNQIGFIEDGLLFSAADGEWFGCYVNGVIYNAFGDAEGFSENAREGLQMMAPGLRASPPKLKSMGPVVRSIDRKPLPEFFSKAQGNRRRQVFG
jgi:hypothetical protein